MRIPVNVVGGAAARELRRENRKLRRSGRQKRKVNRLEDQQEDLRAKNRQAKPAGRGRKQTERPGRAAPRRAPASTPSPSRSSDVAPRGPGPRPGRPGPLNRRPRWDEEEPEQEPEEPAEDVFWDEEGEEPWDEEDEGVGDLRARGRAAVDKARDKVRSLTPNRMGKVLKVGELEVRAPRGERGFVFPLGPNVYLVSQWPDQLVAEQGVQTLGAATLTLARQALAPQSGVGDEVGILGPLAVVLAKKAIEIRAANKAKEAAAPPVPPASAVAGCRCQRRGR